MITNKKSQRHRRAEKPSRGPGNRPAEMLITATRMKPYSATEINFIRDNYKRHSDSTWIAAQLGRNHGAIQQKISKLGIAIPNKIVFTPADIHFLKANYLKLTNRQLAARMGKKRTLVRMKLYEMGLQRVKEKPWTQAEDDVLISNYRTTGDTDISRMLLYRTKGGVRKRRITLGLLRTQAEVAAIIEANKPRFLKHCFKPGHKSGNNNMAKAWETRRFRDSSHEYIINKIQQRENLRA